MVQTLPEQEKITPAIIHKVSKFNQADNWSNVFYLICDYILIFLAILMVNIKPFIISYLISILIIGSRMRALNNLTHEASHQNLFRNPLLNKWLGTLFCSFPIGISPNTYRKSHTQHHKYLGELDKDPDLIRYTELGLDQFPLSRFQLIFHVLKVFFLLHLPRYLYGSLRFFIHSSDESNYEKTLRWIFWIIIFIGLTIFHWWSYFLLFWIVPFFTSFQILRYLAEMSEHAGLYRSEQKMNMTRNNLCHPILRFFLYPHGDYYHLLHHICPGVPHYNLGRVHRILLEDKQYSQANHCYGYFLPTDPNRKSTLEDMML